MPRSDTSDVWFPPSLPELPTFSEPPPPTITGDDLAKMVPPMPTVGFDLHADVISSDEEVEGADAQSSCKRAFPQTQKSVVNTETVAQKPSRKSASARGRRGEWQKKRAADSQAKKAAANPRKSKKKSRL